ncbi:glycosyl hydrolase family 18 protein [Sanguibacter antarcticus]|uniref:chitinase n=1 Tax=Sanguibacter antarcticus TaxID=372484 RepID=A0A2A9E7T2_9MICO|nr:glycosyl hydrolase family 18 protein [Sanguibacter antarcticus]PFG34292.1 chitinase (glycosyl hydrolase family 18) [Sanguibacter antarcticus]
MRSIRAAALTAALALLAAIPAAGMTSAQASTIPTALPRAEATCSSPDWSATTVYTNGDVLSYSGHTWKAKWWTLGETPGTTGEWGVWVDLGTCTDTEVPTPTDPPTTEPTTPPTTTPTAPGTDPGTDPGTGSGSGTDRVVGYFTNWGVYGRDYQVKNIETSGSADELTHVLYAFGNVQNGECTIGDSYADYDKAFTAEQSVDGVADTWDQPLRGNFNQLLKLKELHPDLKVIWSFGGWTWSSGFTQAAADPAGFASSCHDLVEDPRWADVFDGIDIDWEYPNACGASCDTSGHSAFSTLMGALRTEFGDDALVTAAITADGTSGGKIEAADYGDAAQYVDWYMPMTYDFFGAFTPTGPTAPHSALTSYDGIPQEGFDATTTIAKLTSLGIPSDKLLLGLGFYGRGWTGVSQSEPGGTATGAAPGTYEAGIEDYKVLKTKCPATGTVGGTAYASCDGQWWSYDTPETIAGKMAYANQQDLGGAFFWELSGDTTDGELIKAIGDGLS